MNKTKAKNRNTKLSVSQNVLSRKLSFINSTFLIVPSRKIQMCMRVLSL